MGWYYTVEYNDEVESKVNAGGKAREDICRILSNLQMEPIHIELVAGRDARGAWGKFAAHREALDAWLSGVDGLGQGDVLVIQFPVLTHTILFPKVVTTLHERGVKTVLLVHDVYGLRPMMGEKLSAAHKLRIDGEESSAIKSADAIIAHNAKMSTVIAERYGVERSRIVDLGIFDYLIPGYGEADTTERFGVGLPVVIAGNLAVKKAAYINMLPENFPFNLYGLGYSGRQDEYIKYFGAFPPDELPSVMRGSFGLVWDGDAPDTCGGSTGQYLKINNPHKTSLYLASGLPVVVWEEAAIADFVRGHNCGVTVKSLSDVSSATNVPADEYVALQKNALEVGKALRGGCYTKKAINKAAGILGV